MPTPDATCPTCGFAGTGEGSWCGVCGRAVTGTDSRAFSAQAQERSRLWASDQEAAVADYEKRRGVALAREPTAAGPASSGNGEPAIVPLADGEERLLQTVHRPDGNRNDIYLVHRRPSDEETMGSGEPVNFLAIIRSTDAEPGSEPFAWQRGPDERSIYIRVAEAFVNAPPPPGASGSLDPGVQWFVDRIREQHPGPSPMEEVQNRVHLYVAACQEVMSTANACLEKANLAVGARNKIEQHKNDGLPGTPIAIRNFTTYAEEAEREFAPLYEAFDQACVNAREAAGRLLGAGRDPAQAEMVLAMGTDDQTLGTVAAVKSILRAAYGSTPGAFIQGVQESNARATRRTATSTHLFPPHSQTRRRARGALKRSRRQRSSADSAAGMSKISRTRASRLCH